MEGKKSSLKLNMCENRLKITMAKIGVVENAVKETPEKPVGEVWEIAKVAKPAPAPSLPTPTANKDAVVSSTNSAPPPKQKLPEQDSITVPKPSIQPPSGPASTNGSSLPVASSVPTQPSGNRVASGSGIPQPRGGSNIRGAARGSIRGGNGGNGGVYNPPGSRGRGTGNNNNQGGQSRSNSAMGMNPFASNFSPGSGNKRPRDESMGGLEGNGAKRSRGGGRGN